VKDGYGQMCRSAEPEQAYTVTLFDSCDTQAPKSDDARAQEGRSV
jgi:hypothetical protein